MSNGNTFTKLFGQSPFTALQSHMRVVLECAREVLPLIEALADGDQATVIEKKEIIFEREAEAAAALNHPNIVTIHDVIESDGKICIVMEHVDGDSLRTKIDKGVSLAINSGTIEMNDNKIIVLAD